MLGRLRTGAGFTRADLASALDVDLFTIALYENGEPIPDDHAATLGGDARPRARVRPAR
jgi:DNA-binding XRE family transcriptional regulator